MFSMPNLGFAILCFQKMTPKFKWKFLLSRSIKALNFWQLHEWMEVFSEISKGQPHEIYPIFLKISCWKFSFHLTLILKFLEFSVEWFAFLKFNGSQTFWKLSWKNSVPYATVSKSSEVLISWQSRIRKVHLTNKKAGFGSCYPFSQPPLYTMSLVTKLRFIWEHNNVIALLK